MKIRTAFIGTPDFAVPSLKALINDTDFEIVGVITQPDMPVGRHQIMMMSPIKQLALSHDLEVLQPHKIKFIIDQIRDWQLDILIVTAYAQIIPEIILQLPKYGCINVHGSLLPKYRGAAVIQAAITNHDTETGATIMLMDKGLDTGPILSQAKITINPQDTAGDLYDQVALAGAQILPVTIKKYISGEITPITQDSNLASYVGLISKQDGLIDWTKSATDLECFVRAMTPWPSAWTWLEGKQLKIASVSPEIVKLNNQKIGKIFMFNGGLAIQCGKDALLVNKLQLEGKKELSSEEFLRGKRDVIGKTIGKFTVS